MEIFKSFFFRNTKKNKNIILVKLFSFVITFFFKTRKIMFCFVTRSSSERTNSKIYKNSQLCKMTGHKINNSLIKKLYMNLFFFMSFPVTFLQLILMRGFAIIFSYKLNCVNASTNNFFYFFTYKFTINEYSLRLSVTYLTQFLIILGRQFFLMKFGKVIFKR